MQTYTGIHAYMYAHPSPQIHAHIKTRHTLTNMHTHRFAHVHTHIHLRTYTWLNKHILDSSCHLNADVQTGTNVHRLTLCIWHMYLGTYTSTHMDTHSHTHACRNTRAQRTQIFTETHSDFKTSRWARAAL